MASAVACPGHAAWLDRTTGLDPTGLDPASLCAVADLLSMKDAHSLAACNRELQAFLRPIVEERRVRETAEMEARGLSVMMEAMDLVPSIMARDRRRLVDSGFVPVPDLHTACGARRLDMATKAVADAPHVSVTLCLERRELSCGGYYTVSISACVNGKEMTSVYFSSCSTRTVDLTAFLGGASMSVPSSTDCMRDPVVGGLCRAAYTLRTYVSRSRLVLAVPLARQQEDARERQLWASATAAMA